MQKVEPEVLLAQHEDITTTAGSAALAGLGDLTNGVLRYVTNVAMAHMVVPAIYGIFGEVYTVMIILGWMAKLGLDGVLICLLPTYRLRESSALVVGLSRFAIWVTLCSGIVVGALIFVDAPIVARLFYHDPSYRLPLQEMALLIPLFALQLILSSGLQAFKEIKWKVYVDRFSQPLLTLATLCIFYFAGWRMEALSFSVLSGYLCSVLLGYAAMHKILKRGARRTTPAYAPWIWLGYAIPMFFNGFIYGIMNSADILFLSIFATPVQAAIYIAADRVSSFVAMPLVALNMIFSPLIAEYHGNGRHEQLASMLKLVNRWSLSLSLPVFVGSLVFHDAVLRIFGPQYTAGGLALIILCIGNVVNSGTGSVLQLLAMTGRLRIISINSVVTILINSALSFLLVPRFNILGAALAASLAVVILNIISLAEVYWIMKMHPYRWDIYKPVLASAVAYLVGMLLVNGFHPGPGHFSSILELSLLLPFALTYCLVMVMLRFSKEDKIVFHALALRFNAKKRRRKTFGNDAIV